jgi:hypothetical protein
MFKYSVLLRHTNCNTVTDVSKEGCAFIFRIRQSPLSSPFKLFHRQRTLISSYLPSLIHSLSFILIKNHIPINLAGRQTCTAGKLSNKFLKKSFSVNESSGINSWHRSHWLRITHALEHTDGTPSGMTVTRWAQTDVIWRQRIPYNHHYDDMSGSCVHMRAQTADHIGWDVICAVLSYVGFHLWFSRVFTYLANMRIYGTANSRFATNSLSCNYDLNTI